MARPEVIKTQLGQRLRSVRKYLGDPRRESFAKNLGISPKTLANHERGDSAPDANVLAAYREKYGVDINWLVTGLGSMFGAAQPPGTLCRTDPLLMERLSERVVTIFRDIGQIPSLRHITRETAVVYNELATAVPDLRDQEMIEAVLPRVELEFRRRLEQATADPGDSKRPTQAS